MAVDVAHPPVLTGKIPFHRALASFALSCFIGTLLTDLAYWGTAEMMWADFSAWLLTVGVIIGYLAVIVGLVEFFSRRFVPIAGATWPYVVGNAVALILATLNTFVHTRDAWTSVVPWGLILSAVVVLVLLVAAWMGRSMIYRDTME